MDTGGDLQNGLSKLFSQLNQGLRAICKTVVTGGLQKLLRAAIGQTKGLRMSKKIPPQP